MTAAPAVARTAGITFETWRPPLANPLPRMDVAAFVGLAASGPVDVPVAVESSDEFHDIFGDDLRLGVASDGNAVVYAELAPAVRQFFRAGGRRCWIVRVASGAVANRFPLPGLLAETDAAAPPTAAHLVARSPGSWSDSLAVNCTLRTRSIGARWDPTAPGDAPIIDVAPAAGGDLLRLALAGDPSLVGFAPVPERSRRGRRGPTVATVAIDLRTAVWFQSESPEMTTGWQSCVASVLTTALDGTTAAMILAAAQFRRLPGTLVIESDGPSAPVLRPGAWVRVKCQPANPSAASIEYYAMVQQVMEQSRGPQSSRVLIEAVDFWRTVSPEVALDVARLSSEIRADVLTLDVTMRSGHATERLEDLGLVDGHPRFIGDVPDDATWYGARRDEIATTTPTQSAARPRRFPLASPYPGPRATEDVGPMRPALLLPLGVLSLPREDWFQARIPTTDSALERDGVAVFAAGLFFDRALAEVPAARLLDRAFQIQYLERPDARPVALRGMHALLGVAEPSMIAVPDAVHRPAIPRLPLSGWLDAPSNMRVYATSDREARLDWDSPSGATSFRVQRALDPLFTQDVVELPDRVFAFDALAMPTRFFLRVQAQGPDGRIGPWSETVWITLPRRDFLACVDDQPSAPALQLQQAGDTVELQWTQPASLVADTFELQSSQDPSFTGTTVLYRGPSQHFDVWDLATRLAGLRQVGPLEETSIPDLFFRVSATIEGRATPWSNTVRRPGLAGTSPGARTMAPGVSDASELVAIHAALVRLCAARGDMHAILSMPMTWHASQVNDHLAELAARLSQPREAPGGSDDDAQLDRILSFGAAWHPWALVRETSDEPRGAVFATAPDGLIAGTIAARTIATGAWLSPANQLLPGVLQLTPTLSPDEIRSLSPHLNLLREIPQGHTTLSARTLANRPQLLELGVRRLLILVRRLAVREGAAYAFLPNDATLRRLVQREFERVLGDLFARGALAGSEPEDAYRVVVDDSVNPSRAVEEGRLVVELWIAPSQPLVFLTIRLVQGGEELLSVQEG